MASQKAIRGHELVFVDLEVPRLDVDDYEVPVVLRLDLGAHGALVDVVSAAGELLFAVAWLKLFHDPSPLSMVPHRPRREARDPDHPPQKYSDRLQKYSDRHL
jgi:hypothetical protein